MTSIGGKIPDTAWHQYDTTLEVELTLNFPKPDGANSSLGRNVHLTLRINVEKTLNFSKPGGVLTKRHYDSTDDQLPETVCR